MVKVIRVLHGKISDHFICFAFGAKVGMDKGWKVFPSYPPEKIVPGTFHKTLTNLLVIINLAYVQALLCTSCISCESSRWDRGSRLFPCSPSK